MMLDNYLIEFKKELEKRNIADPQDIIDFFHEMINDRIELGEDIQDILNSLGSPETLAQSITTDNKQSNEIKDDETKSEETKTFTEEKHLEFENINKIKIELVSYGFEIYPSDNDKYIIEYNDTESTFLNIKNRDGVLKIEQEFPFSSGRYTFNNLSDFFKKGINVLGQWKGSTAKLYIPSDSLPNTYIETVSGLIKIDGVDLNVLNVEAVSGSIDINNISSSKLDCENVSGRTTIENAIIAEKTSVESVSGKISMKQIKCPIIKAESVSASVDVDIIGNQDDYDINISSLFNSNEKQGNGNCSLYIETVSGRANYNFI